MFFIFMSALLCIVSAEAALEDSNNLELKPFNESAYKTFHDWDKDCAKLPFYREKREEKRVFKPSKLTSQEIEKALALFVATIKKGMHHTDKWLYEKMLDNDFFSLSSDQECLYAQKLNVLPSTIVCCMGDLHGDIHSLRTYLKELARKEYLDADDPFKIKNPNVRILFLGDYVDRGNYGIEVLYTLWRLKVENPENVIMVRGNHEDILLNLNYGFVKEFLKKFPQKDSLLSSIDGFYKLLPCVVYLGCPVKEVINYFQCCHGGMEPGYLPNKLLESRAEYENISILRVAKNITFNPKLKDKDKIYTALHDCGVILQDRPLPKSPVKDPDKKVVVGFLWSDFIPYNDKEIVMSSRQGCFSYGKPFVDAFLGCSDNRDKKYTVCGILRGHQHETSLVDENNKKTMMACILDEKYPETKGAAFLWRTPENNGKKLWKNVVCTFNVTPDTFYGEPAHGYPGFNDATYAELTFDGEDENKWDIAVKSLSMFKPHQALTEKFERLSSH